MAFSLVGGLTMGLQLDKTNPKMMANDTNIRQLLLNFFNQSVNSVSICAQIFIFDL
jgi:hypothetical protein